jgi:CheY-like chemotaxis protein
MMRPLRILVAEDEPGDIALLKRAFSRRAPRVPVHFVTDGQKIIELFERLLAKDGPSRQPFPTLLLLDLKMPHVSGFEVLRWLQAQPQLRELVVVVFSASEDNADRQHAYDLGADGYVVKPRDPAEFIDVIREMEKLWLRRHATPECGDCLEEPAAEHVTVAG